MAILLIAVTAFVIFAIAAVAIGRQTFAGARTARQAVFDLDEAVEFVADRLPADVQARISHDDVRAVLGWYLDELEAAHVAYERDDERLPDDPADDPAADDDADEDEAAETLPDEIVVDEQTLAATVLGRIEEAELGLSDVDVLLVLEEGEQYLRAIGAIGGEAPLL